MKRTFISLIIIVFNGVSGCTPQPVFDLCGIYLRHQSNSTVLKLDRVGIADTKIALVMGTVYEKYNSDTNVTTKTLAGAIVLVTDQVTGKRHSKVSDSNGEYRFYVSPSAYTLHIRYIDFNSLIIRNVQLDTGIIVKFDALLGTGRDSSVYSLQPNNTIISISQPKKRDDE